MYEIIDALARGLGWREVCQLVELVTVGVALALWGKLLWRLGSACVDEVMAKLARDTKKWAPSSMDNRYRSVKQ